MMINKRLIGTVPESKKYVAGNVALQWCSLAANIGMMSAIAGLLASLFTKTADGNTILWTAAAAVFALLVRFVCTVFASRMGYLSSRAVKQTLRAQIYEKLLRLGSSYQEQVKTSEVVQMAVEGVDQLETYFGAYLPQFFYAMLAPLTLFLVLCFGACAARLRAADPDRDRGGADLGKKTAFEILGAVHGARRYLSGKSAGPDDLKDLSGG